VVFIVLFRYDLDHDSEKLDNDTETVGNVNISVNVNFSFNFKNVFTIRFVFVPSRREKTKVSVKTQILKKFLVRRMQIA